LVFADDESLAVALLQIPGAESAVMITDDKDSVVVPVASPRPYAKCSIWPRSPRDGLTGASLVEGPEIPRFR
jgi:hypothetical protein